MGHDGKRRHSKAWVEIRDQKENVAAGVEGDSENWVEKVRNFL